MDIVDVLKSKNVKVREILGWGTYLRKKWEDVFVGHLNDEEKKKIYLHYDDGACGYLWHVFSYDKRTCLVEENADKAFNLLNKNECFIFYQHTDYALLIENASRITANDFTDKNEFDREDVYIVDKDFTWTYVNTHETGLCGPYFSTLRISRFL